MAHTDPFTGEWELNREASRLAGPAPASWTQQIDIADGWLRAHERIVSAEGAISEHVVEARFDGSESAVAGSPVVETMAYTRPEPQRIEGVARKSGVVVFREVVTVSDDAATMTLAFAIPLPDGREMLNVAVFRRWRG